MTNNNFQELLDWLYALQRLGIKTGLTHTVELAQECGNPQNNFPIIHIAGTNGKGSTAAMITSILRESGYQAGLYTSPHLIHFNERIRVDGIPIDDDNIVRFVSEYRPAIERIQATFFETTSIMALWYFRRKKVDVAVIETGLGGRLDSTNIVNPAVTVITPVDMDHTDLLGNSLEEIALEKAGIIKGETPLVLAPQKAAARSIILERAGNLKAPVIQVAADSMKLPMDFQTVGLAGEHQLVNAWCALEAAACFDPSLSAENSRKGLLNVVWPGRFQCLSESPPVYYDVAHNSHGIRAVLDNISRQFNNRPIGIIALKGDKDLSMIASILSGRFSALYTVGIPDADVIPAVLLAQKLSAEGVACEPAESIEEAFSNAAAGANDDKPVLIFGSHYIAKNVFRWFDFPFERGVI